MAGLFGVFVWSGAANRPAEASNPVSAATSYLSFTVRLGTNNKFYITDTNRKVICVYTLAGEKLRLVSARNIDNDSKIVDGSIQAPIAIEGAGVTRTQAEQYAQNCKPLLDNLAKKYNQPVIGGQNP